ncbi:MFS transporter [Patescibacteria group bacterium]|nr:MFS transporter [Patescibacteria group bacterium]
MKARENWLKGIQISKVIQFLTYSDVLMMSGWGLISPIMAVYFTDKIIGGSIAVAGLASTIYFLVKSIVQIPVARWIDKRHGEMDDYHVMIIGSVLITFAAFSYAWVNYPWQLYLVQVVYGLGGAFSFPSWLALFTRHVDKRQEGLEWSLYYTATDLGAALAAGLGGLLAQKLGFTTLFFLVGIMSGIGTIFLVGIVSSLKKK